MRYFDGSKNRRIFASVPPPGPPCTKTAGLPSGFPERRSRLVVTAVGSLLGASATVGCMLKPQDNGADKYRQAIAQTNDVSLGVPKSGGGTSSTTAYSTKGVYTTKGGPPTTSDA